MAEQPRPSTVLGFVSDLAPPSSLPERAPRQGCVLGSGRHAIPGGTHTLGCDSGRGRKVWRQRQWLYLTDWNSWKMQGGFMETKPSLDLKQKQKTPAESGSRAAALSLALITIIWDFNKRGRVCGAGRDGSEMKGNAGDGCCGTRLPWVLLRCPARRQILSTKTPQTAAEPSLGLASTSLHPGCPQQGPRLTCAHRRLQLTSCGQPGF